jgi:hypothetical protein
MSNQVVTVAAIAGQPGSVIYLFLDFEGISHALSPKEPPPKVD